jgi:excisionase family DNA binding protein
LNEEFITREKQSENTSKVLTADEVSHYLKIPLSTLYGLTKRNQIKGTKVGKHWRYLEEDVRYYLIGFSAPQHNTITNEKPAFNERRTSPRINCEVPAEILVLLPQNRQTFSACTVKNLSEGGVFLTGVSTQGLCVGDPVRIIFDISENQNQKIETRGRVVHSQGSTGTFFGIKFKPLAAEERGMVRDYVG